MRNGPIVTLMATLYLTPAVAQDVAGEENTRSTVVSMTCTDLAALDPQIGGQVIYYIAGYSDGQRTSIAASGPAVPETGAGENDEAEEAAAAGNEQDQASESAAPEGMTSAGAAGGEAPSTDLGISVGEILTACAEAPDSPASEVISLARGSAQPEVDPQEEDPAAEGEEGQNVGSGNAVVE